MQNIVSIKNNIAKTFKNFLSKRGNKSYKKKWIQLGKDKISEIKYKMEHLHETNILLGLKHYYDGSMFDAMLRFRLVNSFKKNDEQSLQNMALCLYRKNDLQKLCKLLDKIAELYPENEILAYIREKQEKPEQILHLPTTLYNNYFSYNVFLQKQIPAEQRKNLFLLNVLAKYYAQEDFVRFLDVNCNCGENGITAVDFFKECHVTGVEISSCVLKICSNLKLKNRDVYNEILEQKYEEFVQNENNFQFIAINFHFHFHSDLENVLRQTVKIMNENSLLYFKIQNTHDAEWQLDKDLDLFCYSHRFLCDTLIKCGFSILEVKHQHEEKNENQESGIRKILSSEFLVKKSNNSF